MLKAQKVHFVAIGGYGMSGLAMVLLKSGLTVSGSDVGSSTRTDKLIEAGAEVHIGAHDASYIDGVDVVVYSTQVSDNNPELVAARSKGLRVIHRSELLAEFINRQTGIAVAGTHGKTTTTSMIALLLLQGGLDPTVFVGGEMDAIGGTGRAGKGPYVVAEADESDRSFLRYHPAIAVATNVEAEHLEYWEGDFQQIIKGFRQFLSQIQSDGLAVLCSDDPHLRTMGQDLKTQQAGPVVLFYGTGADAQWQARNIHPWENGIAYDCIFDGKAMGEIRLPIPGRHNAMNSLAAVAVASHLGLSIEQVKQILLNFSNAKRRYQVWANVNDITVVDDYAHHPTEIAATLAAAKERAGRRVLAVFQPQRYSRTHWLMDQFATSFSDADLLILTPIYSPPGETPIPGVTSGTLAERISANTGRSVQVIADKQEILELLLRVARPGDTVLTMGAGDIWTVAQELTKRISTR